MNQNKHTPGPWTVCADGSNWVTTIDDNNIADCDMGYARMRNECASNARLIAAAPDLLSALRSCPLFVGVVDPGILQKWWDEIATPAICKTEGEANDAT